MWLPLAAASARARVSQGNVLVCLVRDCAALTYCARAQCPTVAALLNKFRAVVVAIRDHREMREALRKKQANKELLHDFEVEGKDEDEADAEDDLPRKRALKLVQEVITRWNSTLAMLQRLVEVRSRLLAKQCVCVNDSIAVFVQLMEPVKFALLAGEAGKLHGAELSPSDAEWESCKKLVQFLLPFRLATKLFEGEKVATLGLVSRVITGLVTSLEAPAPPAMWLLNVQSWDVLPG